MTPTTRAAASGVTVSAAARTAGVSERTVKTWFDNGEISGTRTAAGARFIDPDSLARRLRAVSVAEAARRAGCCERTIRVWFDTGRIAGYRSRSGQRRIDTDSLQHYLGP